MTLAAKIEEDMRNAMKSGDSERAGTLKMLKSDLMYEKAKTGIELNDDQILDVIKRAAKKRKEAIKEYENAGRNDLADKEKIELKIIEEYLPEQMSEEEISKVLDRIIAEAGEVSQKMFGKLMGIASKELKGKADGNIIKEILQKKLEGK
ncbi:MAG TPA: GatB/YqeY domain-containing protein [Spirochaetota bacterium]|nr:GatB/YqeY domain-containing protein [Spirochaetota bacterium]HPP95158.1 GatB/YqeY domain-containing protein [Spirochaetota bacterium]HRS62086.1 GatB/YqeY domain-containing protein [Spirochaetota bacterium]